MSNDTLNVEVVSSDLFQARVAAMGRTEFELKVGERQAYDKDFLAFSAVKYSGRREIPYGRWTTKDGREVIFNREYQPMYSRSLRPGDASHFCDRAEYVLDIIKVEYFYGDHNSPVDYLTRKFKGHELDKEQSSVCRNSLVICMSIVRNYEPKRDRDLRGTSWRTFLDEVR